MVFGVLNAYLIIPLLLFEVVTLQHVGKQDALLCICDVKFTEISSSVESYFGLVCLRFPEGDLSPAFVSLVSTTVENQVSYCTTRAVLGNSIGSHQLSFFAFQLASTVSEGHYLSSFFRDELSLGLYSSIQISFESRAQARLQF